MVYDEKYYSDVESKFIRIFNGFTIIISLVFIGLSNKEFIISEILFILSMFNGMIVFLIVQILSSRLQIKLQCKRRIEELKHTSEKLIGWEKLQDKKPIIKNDLLYSIQSFVSFLTPLCLTFGIMFFYLGI